MKYSLTVIGRTAIGIDFNCSVPIERVKYKVNPRSAKPLVDGLLKGSVDERGILFSDGMGSPVGVGLALQRKGYIVKGIPDYKLKEDVK